MSYLVFKSKEEADNANNIISQNRGLPKGSVNAGTGEFLPEILTTSWAIPQSYIVEEEEIWYFEKPDDDFMTGVTSYEEVKTVDLPAIEGLNE